MEIESFDDELDDEIDMGDVLLKPNSFNKDNVQLEFSDSDSVEYER